jgi:hypothetical protein
MAITNLAQLSATLSTSRPSASTGTQPGSPAVPGKPQLPSNGLPEAVSGKIHPLMQRYLTAEDKVILSEAYEQAKNERDGEAKTVRLALRYATVRYGEALLARSPDRGASQQASGLPGPLLKTPVRQALAALIEWQQTSRQAQAAKRYADISKAS